MGTCPACHQPLPDRPCDLAAELALRKAENSQLFFNLVAPNGQTIPSSERYNAKAGAKSGIA
jgi:uncharacterized protein YegP (UPF0339 family)